MDHLLYARIYGHHPSVKIWMVCHQHLRIPGCSDEYGVYATSDRRHKDLAHLETDQERECHDDRSVSTTSVICWLRKFKIKIGEESAEVRYEGGSHGQDRPNKAIVYESVNATVFHHLPGVLGSRDVGFAVESDVRESIAIDESTDASVFSQQGRIVIRLTIRPIERGR